MISLVAYGLLVLVLLAIVIVVTMVGGDVSVVVAGYEVTTTFPRLVLVVAGIALTAVVLVWLVGWIWKGPRMVHQVVMRRRRERGYEALTSGLVAIAAGDAREARRHARKADDLLGHPPFTLLLTAQAAQLDGDDATAEKQFTAMLDSPETEFLGLRGLMAAALRRGDRGAARDYAVRAHALRPDARWAAEAVFDLQTLAGDWNGAQRTLETALDRKAVSARTSRKRRAALLLEEGRQALENLDRAHALKRVREAHAEAPDLVPATALLARLLIDDQKLRQAAKVIEKGWAATPHPELAAIYVETGRDSGVTHYKRISKLVKIAPGARESHLAAVRAAIDTDLIGEARRHLQDLGDEPVTTRVARLWVALEERDGNEEEAARWRERAVDADPEATWQCDRCGHVDAVWHAVCAGCGTFDSAVWRTPGRLAGRAIHDGGLLALMP